MRGDDVRIAVQEAVSFLEPLAAKDWSVKVPDLDFTVASVLAHAAEGPLWYAIDYTAGPGNDTAFELKVRPDAEPAHLLVSLRTAAALSAMTVDALPPGQRGYHPFGTSDADGFAAMACDEILVHAYDAGLGLGECFTPGADLAGQVLARLFPWQEPGADPWTALLRANGRIDLPDSSRQRTWRWHVAPLAEWDGTRPF
jgi:hypothetical protein